MTSSDSSERLELLSATLLAVERREEFIRIVTEATDADEARKRIQSAFLLSEPAATHVMSLQMFRLTRDAVQRIRSDYEEITSS